MAWNRRAAGKYGAVRTACSRGHSHRSKLESEVCGIISLREKAGELKLEQAEDHVRLTRAGIVYVADFRVTMADGSARWIEAKGMETDVWLLKKKLWRVYGPGTLEIWKAGRGGAVLVETIHPGG